MQMQIQSDTGKVVAEVVKGLGTGASAAQQNVQGEELTFPQESPNVEASVANLQKNLELMKETNFQVEYDRDIDRVIVKYTNLVGEVVRQVPTKDFVEFEKEFVRTIGLMFDKKV